MIGISFCVSVCDESTELDILLGQLLPNLEDCDEVIVLIDISKTTPEVKKVIESYKSIYPDLKVVEGSLDNDFGTFKNKFIKVARKEYIMQLDCDEILSEDLLHNLKLLLEENREVDMFAIPRENYVENLTEEWIKKWNWRVDEKGRINYDDAQQRLFKNNGIKWQNKVHEVLVGYKTYSKLPENFYLIHKKSLDKQIKQNNFYNTL